MRKMLLVLAVAALAACAGKEKAQGASMSADTMQKMSADTTHQMADSNQMMSQDSMARDTSHKM